jgi:hypothetical protein
MSFTFPKSLLPPKKTAYEIIRDHSAMMDNRDALRAIYRKARQAEKAEADRIRQVWRAEAEARTAERKAKMQEAEAALLATLPDEPPPPEYDDDETRAWFDSLRDDE